MSDQPNYPSYPGAQPPEQTPPGYQPPPPPGYQPPPPGYQPPPPGYGQAPPPGYGQVPPGYAHGYPPPASPFASWGARVGAYLLDALIGFAVTVIPLTVGLVLAFKDATVDSVTGEVTGGVEPVGIVVLVLGYLVGIGFSIWNFVFRQGRTGQSLGKKIVNIKVVKEATGQPTGPALALGRVLLVSLLSGVTCYINLLWPLWDDKRQALHDKVVSTVVLSGS